MVEEIIQAGESWPFGPLHYYERLKINYAKHGVNDIFAHYRSSFITYNFFGQQLIEIDRVCAQPLEHAEKLYFTAAKQLGLPAEATFQVSRNTAAFNFRGHRQNVQQTLFLDATRAGLLRHNTGRAIDVNTTAGRNPHVKHDKSIWLPVQAVLAYAGRSDLAAIPFSQAGKDRQEIEAMLAASQAYQQHYAAWKRGYPATLVVPFDRMPTPEAFTTALRAQGLGAASPEVVSEQRTANAADHQADQARAALRTMQQERQRAMAKTTRTLRAQLGKKLGKSQQERYHAPQARLTGVLDRVDSALAAWGKALQRSPGERDAADAWREAAQAVDAALAELRLTLLLIGHAFPFELGDVPTQAKTTGFAQAVASLRRALQHGPLSGTGTQAIATSARTLESRDGWVDQTISRPHLLQRGRAAHELAVLTAYRTFRGELERWAKQGFVDHPVLFVWAMQKAGWRYGAEYSSPDFHHFEWLR